MKTLAKSLHTVTALQRVATYCMQRDGLSSTCYMRSAVDEAARILGYDYAPDPYALKQKALEAMCAQRKADEAVLAMVRA